MLDGDEWNWKARNMCECSTLMKMHESNCRVLCNGMFKAGMERYVIIVFSFYLFELFLFGINCNVNSTSNFTIGNRLVLYKYTNSIAFSSYFHYSPN